MAERGNLIIVADDDFYVRSLVKIALGPLVQIIEASSGEEVLPLYKEHKPALLFLDIHMPKQGGMDVLKNVLAFDPDAYVAMLSADSTAENVKETCKLGAKGFVTKPFTKEILLKYVASCPGFEHLFRRPESAANG